MLFGAEHCITVGRRLGYAILTISGMLGGFIMTAKQISAYLIIVLAIIAAVVATGLIAGYVMQAWIVAYWIVLTMKNVVDYIEKQKQ